MDIYYPFSKYLFEKYGEKVYKLPINIEGTCPNRDGSIGKGGCHYCSEVGAGYESLSNKMTIKDQLLQNKEYIGKRYNAKKFIAYFQNYSGTYMHVSDLYRNLKQAVLPDIVCINISTRPDCISEEVLDTLDRFTQRYGVEVALEIGLQTANYKTLRAINRGHDLSQFIDAVMRTKARGYTVCIHVIVDFPFDDMEDVVQTAKIVSALGVDGVKMHSLYIPKGTVFHELYENGKLELLDLESYIQRVIAFLTFLSPDIYIERLIGRIPQSDSVIANFHKSWWVIKEQIEDQMRQNGYYQGMSFNYLNGSALNGINKRS